MQRQHLQNATPLLDIEYARSVVEQAPQLERVQKMLPLLPPDVIQLFRAKPDEFLYGASAVVQAIHDLLGNRALDDVSELVANEAEEENIPAMRLAKLLVATYGLLEAMGLRACEELVKRHLP